MIFRRPPNGREAGQHRDGHTGAPRVLVLADVFDTAYRQMLGKALERLHARGAINFSAYSQADVDAGGARCWARWIRECSPVTVVLARCGLPGDEDILDYCHNRGIAVVCYADEGCARARKGPRFQDAQVTLLAACDLICATAGTAAETLRGRYPKRKVMALEVADAGAFAQQLLEATTQLAQRSAVQKVLGACRRVPAFAASLAHTLLQRAWGPVQRDGDPGKAPLRVLFVANSFLPTLQLCFTRPLQPLADADQIAWEVLADIQLHRPGRVLSGGRAHWARRRIDQFQPQLVVFCRYSGVHARLVTDWAREHGVPTIYHLDDDLLNVPKELGPEKHAFHHQPARLAAVRHLLDTADVVYCSTPALLQRMQQHGIGGRGLAARIHCPGEVLRGAPGRAPVKIGYMGIDHAHDFEVALPALIRILERNPQVCFELFGPIAKPAALDRFGGRVTRVGFVRSYDGFLGTFAALGWAIGICPLADTPFNRTKANNKWVEYTCVGAATVATAGMLYDECCADGCGLLAGNDAEWEAALQSLIDDPQRRLAMVAAAQERLRRDYSVPALRQQVQELFDDVLSRARRMPAGEELAMKLATAEVVHGD